MTLPDDTCDPALRSWVGTANDPTSDFPIQNLPFGRFRAHAAAGPLRIGVAIGDQVLDLRAAGLIDTADMTALMAAGPQRSRALRRSISQFLRGDSAPAPACLVAQADVEMALPCHIGDYTDFYTSIHHATTVGKQFRPDHPLLPNYKWVPIGYHGRASSIGVSGESFPRPRGRSNPRRRPRQASRRPASSTSSWKSACSSGDPTSAARRSRWTTRSRGSSG
jgi:fumarylacetoacetase